MSKRWYNNGIKNIFIEGECPEGYVCGMKSESKEKMREHERTEEHKKRLSESHKGKVPWNKGIPMSEETKRKQSESHRGQVAWNKGLTNETDNRVALSSMRTAHTKKEKYGNPSPNYGKHLSAEHKEKIGKSNSISLKGKHLPKDKLIIKTTKQYLTRKANKTFNTSSKEDELYEQLCKDYVGAGKEVLRQYKDKERYPYYCDFYIPSEDLFIELNAHWTHGGKPYDPNDEECQKQLTEWKEKAKTSKFYENAIATWTIRDVEKRKVAEENILNYRTIY